ncbi:MAG: VWA domain-containing protein [Gemmataceae bacterium]|nr:VWA domain-containing protein [Gemmataceae bacterium]
MRTIALAILTLTLLANTTVRAQEPPAAQAPAQNPAQAAPAQAANVDLALCLDVSGSMSGLINSAKSRLWDIVNEFAKAKPTPNLRVALYSYGHTTYDKNAGWVRKELDFTADLDQVNDKLFALTINGGTELVARVTTAALDQLSWSKDPKAFKVIFVCGNESARQDKQITLQDVAAKALERGVIVNTIFCGAETTGVSLGWRDFALQAEGRYAAINQNKAVARVPTPYDKKIADLGAKLGTTYLFAGRERKALEENQRRQDANAAKQGADVAAGRALSKATGVYRFAEDLVERAQKKEKLELDKIAEAELPEALKKLPAAEREKHVQDLAKERAAIQKEILELNRQREQFLRDAARPAAGAAPGLDDALRGTIREQAKKKGIKLEK